MKVPFRFFRGEFNGDYVRAFLLSRNNSISSIVDELVYQATFTWKLPGDVLAGESPIREEDVVNLARFAGVPRPVQYIENNLGSIKFTGSDVVNGAQRSERGLFNMDIEGFEFVRTANDDYPSDISTDATNKKRMTLVPSGTTPVGYVPLGVDIFEADGTLIPGNLLSSPPMDGTPYTTYYGDKYLFTEETFVSEAAMSIDMFMAYYECIMRIRSNGASIKELLYLTELFGAGYITNIEVQYVSGYYVLYYYLDNSFALTNKIGRLAAWKTIIGKRFKEFVLSERT